MAREQPEPFATESVTGDGSFHDRESRWPGPEYAARMAAGDIPYQRCATCERSIFFPRLRCPVCGSGQLEWQRSAGLGVVYSATTIYVRDGTPYIVALVDFDEGFRGMAQVADAHPTQELIGASVAVSVARVGDAYAFIARAQSAGGS